MERLKSINPQMRGESAMLDLLISFLAPFSGVVLAFVANRIWEWHSDNQARMRLLYDLRVELLSCKDNLEKLSHRLPTPMWTSALASGEIRLLPSVVKRELATLYQAFEAANYEADQYRDAKEEIEKQGLDQIENVAKAQSSELVDYQIRILRRLTQREEELKGKIDSTLQKPWWPPS